MRVDAIILRFFTVSRPSVYDGEHGREEDAGRAELIFCERTRIPTG